MSENNQDVTMGNQQERPSEAELGWLAGIVDGEGSISLVCNSTHRSIYPILSITSVNREIVDKCEKIIKKIDVKYSIGHAVPPKGKEWTPHSYIRILTSRRMKIIIECLQPYLTAKQPHCKIILEFCNSRIYLPYGHPYTERELQLFYEIRKYQIKKGKTGKGGIPNDYTPGWRPRYKIRNPRNIRNWKKKNIKLLEDIV